jgi:hypothetical protein
MSPENLKTVAIALVFITGFISAASVLYPMARGWARRLEGRGDRHEAREELEMLQERINDLERQVSLVPELEERLDFAERLLAQRGELPRLAPGVQAQADTPPEPVNAGR